MNKAIKRLLQYAIQQGILEEADLIYARNQVLHLCALDEYEDVEIKIESLTSPQAILDEILDDCIARGLLDDTITSRDNFDTKIMNCLLQRPSDIQKTFFAHYAKDPKLATDYYYHFAKASNYIRSDRIEKDEHWVVSTKYGDFDITINMSKPEKDPRDIAKAKLLHQGAYPKCVLCKENEGYSGTLMHASRDNLRIIPVRLHQELYYLQYSPYSYYNEHCIVFHEQHIPMQINAKTFRNLLDFVRQYPHYFIGSNADLPIVGGSILAHDHYQGGRYHFAIEQAKMCEEIGYPNHANVTYGRVYWPLSVLRLRSERMEDLVVCATDILEKWQKYHDASLDIKAFSDDVAHHTITPIARKRGTFYELDLTLRDNQTSRDHPLGIFHPHAQFHHIKKENIGLIEVMGLAVLPSRLKQELTDIITCITEKKALPEALQSHQEWVNMLQEKCQNKSFDSVQDIVKAEVGYVFEQVLENCGVFKNDDAGQAGFLRFMEHLKG